MRMTKGSGNVFRDLGLPDADLLQAKADLVHRISVVIGKRGLTQIQAADVLGSANPRSRLCCMVGSKGFRWIGWFDS